MPSRVSPRVGGAVFKAEGRKRHRKLPSIMTGERHTFPPNDKAGGVVDKNACLKCPFHRRPCIEGRPRTLLKRKREDGGGGKGGEERDTNFPAAHVVHRSRLPKGGEEEGAAAEGPLMICRSPPLAPTTSGWVDGRRLVVWFGWGVGRPR